MKKQNKLWFARKDTFVAIFHVILGGILISIFHVPKELVASFLFGGAYFTLVFTYFNEKEMLEK